MRDGRELQRGHNRRTLIGFYCREASLITTITQKFYSRVYWYKVLTILLLISTELGWIKCDNNRFLPHIYFRGGDQQHTYKAIYTELGWVKSHK